MSIKEIKKSKIGSENKNSNMIKSFIGKVQDSTFTGVNLRRAIFGQYEKKSGQYQFENQTEIDNITYARLLNNNENVEKSVIYDTKQTITQIVMTVNESTKLIKIDKITVTQTFNIYETPIEQSEVLLDKGSFVNSERFISNAYYNETSLIVDQNYNDTIEVRNSDDTVRFKIYFDGRVEKLEKQSITEYWNIAENITEYGSFTQLGLNTYSEMNIVKETPRTIYYKISTTQKQIDYTRDCKWNALDDIYDSEYDRCSNFEPSAVKDALTLEAIETMKSVTFKNCDLSYARFYVHLDTVTFSRYNHDGCSFFVTFKWPQIRSNFS